MLLALILLKSPLQSNFLGKCSEHENIGGIGEYDVEISPPIFVWKNKTKENEVKFQLRLPPGSKTYFVKTSLGIIDLKSSDSDSYEEEVLIKNFEVIKDQNNSVEIGPICKIFLNFIHSSTMYNSNVFY